MIVLVEHADKHVAQLWLHVTYPVHHPCVYKMCSSCQRPLFTQHLSQYACLNNDFSMWVSCLTEVLLQPIRHINIQGISTYQKTHSWSSSASFFPKAQQSKTKFPSAFSCKEINHLRCHITVNLITFQCVDQESSTARCIELHWYYVKKFIQHRADLKTDAVSTYLWLMQGQEFK